MKEFLVFALMVLSCYGAITVYQTTKDTNDRVTRKADIPWSSSSSSTANTDATIKVDTTIHRQSILGFGGAFTEAAAYLFAQMSPEQQEQVLNLYYDKNGLFGGYSLGRIPMGSCDFTLSTYSLCDKAGDYEMTTFDSALSRDNKYMLPLIHKAIKRSSAQLKIFGSPWSPPAWMKKPHPFQKGTGMNGTAYPNGLYDGAEYHKAWALYISKWIEAYINANVPIWGITVQNEPQAIQAFESCLYTRENEKNFIVQHLGPIIASKWPEMKIMAWDHNKHRKNTNTIFGPTDRILTDWVKTMYSDNEISKYVNGIAIHWYQYDEEGFEFDLLETSHSMMPNNTFILNTEACTCGLPNPNNWYGAELYGIDIAGDLAHWTVGWVDWNLILDEKGGPNHIKDESCEAPLIYNTTSHELLVLPKIYYLAHFVKFLRPGSVVVQTENSDESGDPFKLLTTVSAIGINGETILIVVNPGSNSRSFAIIDKATSRSAITSIPAHSIQTLLY